MKILIKNTLALLPDGKYFKLENADISIVGNQIEKIAEAGSMKEEGFEKVLDGKGKLTMPGLINAHTHAYMSLFRNFADDMDFWDWLNKVQTVEEDITEEDCYWGTLLNCIEMIKTGTTSYVDMHIKCAKAVEGPESSCAGAALKAGLRAFVNRGIAGDVTDEDTMTKFGKTLKEVELFKEHDRIKIWMGPHAPYSCMADMIQYMTAKAKELGTGLTIHLSESEGEVAGSMEQRGKTPIKYVADLGTFEVPVIAAHCVNATADDIQIFKEQGVSVAINPKSNMKLGNGFAPVDKFLEAGVNVCLGTDGCGSNNTQNMFQEMNAAALIYKGKEKKAQCVDAVDVLRFATVNGAKAVDMEGKLGELKAGALADIILLDLHEPQFYPKNNIITGLVYSSTGAEVETVIVDGEILMEDRKILSIDVDQVYEECEKIAQRLKMH